MEIALVGYQIQQQYTQGVNHDEDAELLAFLRGKGLSVRTVIWNDAIVDWKTFDLVLLKSPWDYHEHIQAFNDWLDTLKNAGVKVLNPVEIVKWNSNKRYLLEVAEKGFKVIPSLLITNSTVIGHNLFEHFNATQLVVKPCVSAGAKNTIVINKGNITEKAAILSELVSTEDYLVQPFVPEINNGEWSFIFFNGQYSHCVLKTPKAGDFRVQHYLGGAISFPQADAQHIEQAKRYIQAFAPLTLYARVDGVLINNTFELMELELIEPYLFLHATKDTYEKYYQALIELI